MKETFPLVAPTIEIFPGVHAELMADFDRYSNGNLFMGYAECVMSENGIKIGSMNTDVTGRWFVQVGQATYEVPMTALFSAFVEAHTRPAEVR